MRGTRMNELRTRLVVGVAVVALAGGSVLNTVAAGGEPAAASAFVPQVPHQRTGEHDGAQVASGVRAAG